MEIQVKKLGLVVPGLEQGGGVPAVARFIRDVALRSGRYELRIVSLCMSSNDPCSTRLMSPASWFGGISIREAIWEGVPFVHVGASFGELEFQRYRPRKVLSRLLADCDVIQVVCGSPAWANAVSGICRPIALQVATRARVERRRRDMSPIGIKGIWRKSMTNVTDRLDVRGLRLASAIQVENLWMLDYAELVNSGRLVDLRYAPPGINACVFRPSPERSANNMNYILCVGRLDDPRKNLDLLLSAYAFLPETLRDRVCLVLAGSSSPPTVFWQRAEELGVRQRVSFVSRPSRDELVRLYQSASVFVLPSDEEGFGVVLLEAMACAVPAVATRCGGPEGIITDGQDGFLVALNDVQKMTERLRLLLEDGQLNDTMGRRARRTIEERFDESVAGAEFLDMWDSLVRKQDPHEANGNVNPK